MRLPGLRWWSLLGTLGDVLDRIPSVASEPRPCGCGGKPPEGYMELKPAPPSEPRPERVAIPMAVPMDLSGMQMEMSPP